PRSYTHYTLSLHDALPILGNAYADEVLFEARIHPKAMVRSLSEADLDRLHDAIVKVLGHARQVIRDRKPELHEKIRDFLQVRGRDRKSTRLNSSHVEISYA